MTKLERALAFEETLRERCAERIVPFRFGRAFFTDSLPLVWDLNHLRLERLGGASAAEVVAEAERIQGEAGLAHRRVVAAGEVAGSRLERGFRELGWKVDRFVLMGHGRTPANAADIGRVAEVDRTLLEPLRVAAVREQPWGQDAETVRQIVAEHALVAEAISARHFAVIVDGTAVSGADLYSDGATAQIEDVMTLPEHRGRGYASAVVLAALAEARAAGHDLVFLTADADDWPKELYRRLGFHPLGAKYAFLRPPPGP